MDDCDDVGDPLCHVSSLEAHSAFIYIKAFLLRNEGADRCYYLLRDLEMELRKVSASTYTQTSIPDSFQKMYTEA